MFTDMISFTHILKIIRPKQWIKNTFVFIPMFFGGSLLDAESLLAVLPVFMAFSLAASSVYCFNDIIDADDDRRHPVKCRRPIASGAISVTTGYSIMIFMISLSVAITALTLPAGYRLPVGAIIGAYYIMNLAYCARLKQYAIVDVCIIAIGFVLRILAGGIATDTALSKWIVLMTFLLTLFLSLAKRRDDVLRMNKTGEAPRKNTIRYNLTFINQAITITVAVTLVCYIMYTVSPDVIDCHHTQYLYLTSIFVFIGLLRYLQIAMVDQDSGDPTKIIWRDRFTQLTILSWGLTFLVIIYF